MKYNKYNKIRLQIHVWYSMHDTLDVLLNVILLFQNHTTNNRCQIF